METILEFLRLPFHPERGRNSSPGRNKTKELAMNTKESLNIIRALAEGVDPWTMAPLPSDSPLQSPSFIRAFFVAVKALEVLVAQEERRSRLPQNTGKPWSPAEDQKLLEAFDRGLAPQSLAAEFGRTLNAIRTRLAAHGRLAEEFHS